MILLKNGTIEFPLRLGFPKDKEGKRRYPFQTSPLPRLGPGAAAVRIG